MSIERQWIQCPSCGGTLNVPLEKRGTRIACPACDRELYVDRESNKTYSPEQWIALFGKREEKEERRQLKLQKARERKTRKEERRRMMKKRIDEILTAFYDRRRQISIVLAAVAVLLLLAMRFRYSITNAGNGAIYKTDNITGKTWYIRGFNTYEVKDRKP